MNRKIEILGVFFIVLILFITGAVIFYFSLDKSINKKQNKTVETSQGIVKTPDQFDEVDRLRKQNNDKHFTEEEIQQQIEEIDNIKKQTEENTLATGENQKQTGQTEKESIILTEEEIQRQMDEINAIRNQIENK